VPPYGLVGPVGRKSLIFDDAVVFGMEILAGKNRELRCFLHCSLLLNEVVPGGVFWDVGMYMYRHRQAIHR
jgi:hypothetical protein